MPDLGIMVRLGGQDAGAAAAVQQLIGAVTELTAAVTASTAATQAAAQSEAEAAAATEALTAAEAEATTAAEAETGALSALAEAGATVKTEFVGGFKEMAAGLIAFETAREVLGKVVETEREMQQAQLQLDAVYGKSAEDFARYSEELARGTNFTATQAKQAAVQFAELQRDYGLTDQQVQHLLTTTADLAASMGVPLVQASTDVAAVMRGQTRAGAELGLNLRANTAAVQDLSKEQRDALKSTDPYTSGMARLAVIMAEGSARTGEAAKQAGEAGDQFAQLDKKAASLFETMGKSHVGQAVATDLGTAAESADHLVQIMDILIAREKEEQALRAAQPAAGAGPLAQSIEQHNKAAAAILQKNNADLQEEQVLKHLGLAQEDAAAQTAALADDVKNAATETDAARKALGDHANALATAAQATHAYSAEVVQTAESAKAEEERIKKATAALSEQDAALAKAQQSRHAYNIVAGQSEGQAALDKFNKDQATKQKEADTKAEQLAREHWDRMNSLEDRALQDGRTLEDRQRQAAQQAQMDGLKAEEQNLSESVQRQIAERERLRDATLAALDAEAQAAKDEHDRALKQVAADEAAAAAVSIGGLRAIGRARTPRQEADERLQAALDSIATRRKAEQDAAQAAIDALKAQQSQAERTYQGMESAASKFWQREQDRIADTRRAFDEAMADYRYAFGHPDSGAAGPFNPQGGGQGGGTAGAQGGAFGAAAGWKSIVVNQTITVNAASPSDGLLDQVERAAREGTRQALAVAGPI